MAAGLVRSLCEFFCRCLMTFNMIEHGGLYLIGEEVIMSVKEGAPEDNYAQIYCYDVTH